MSPDAWITLGVVLLNVALLIFTPVAPDIVLVGGVTLLLLSGVLSPGQALAGLANEGTVTVGVLYVVVAGLSETGVVHWIGWRLLGRPKSRVGAQLRVMAPVAAMSAFLNNTPLVATMLPAVGDWARRNRLSVSKLMLPLSYAAVLGGTCSLIGTSTNLVVNGLLLANTDVRLGMFDVAWIGLPCTILGITYVLVASRWLLPERRRAVTRQSDPREYAVEMIMDAGCPLAGKSIEDAGLRHLPGLYLAEIGRAGRVLPAVAPHEVLQQGDRLVFVGVVESVVELQKIRGLVPAPDQLFKLDTPRPRRLLVEAVVSGTCPVVGMSIREGRFRTRYNAVVIAVSRSGERLRQKIGDIVLRPGDTLLMEAGQAFAEEHRNSRDFFLVSPVANSQPPRHDRAILAGMILGGMVLSVALGWLSMLQASLLAAGVMLVSRCVTGRAARRSVDWQVLVVIAASIGLGAALETSGAAASIARFVVDAAAGNPWLSLAVVYALTTLFTELITNTGAAVLMFPIALATAAGLGVSFVPFAVSIMMAASFGFASPIGYQTHLMVYGPGGYRFADYLTIGLPLDLLMGIVTVSLAPRVWPF